MPLGVHSFVRQRLSLSRKKLPQLPQTPQQQVVRKIPVASRGITPSLNRVMRAVKSKAKHAITLPSYRANLPQKPAHFSLREEKNLRRPPSPQLTALSRVYCRIERNQTKEVCLRWAVEVVEPRIVAERPLRPRGRRRPGICSRRLDLDACYSDLPTAAPRNEQIHAWLLAGNRSVQRVAFRCRKQPSELLSNTKLRVRERKDRFHSLPRFGRCLTDRA